jgi:sodium/proline symporter
VEGLTGLNYTVLVLIVLYIAIVWVIGFWVSRRAKTMSDYLIAGKKLGLFVLIFGLMAAFQSGWTWIGLPGALYMTGYPTLIGMITFGGFLGFVISWYLVAVPLRRLADTHGAMTLPDALDALYNSRVLRVIAALAILIGSTAFLMAQWAALASLSEQFLGITYKQGVLLMAVVVGVYMVAGGMLASMYTNVVQMIWMLFGSITVFSLTLINGGGANNIHSIIARANPAMLQYYNPSFGFSLVYIWVWIFMFFFTHNGQPQIAAKCYSAKSTDVMKWSLVIVTITHILGSLVAYSGLQVRALVEQGIIPPLDHPDLALPIFIAYYTPSVLQGLIAGGVFAATMSTAESFVINGSSALIRDIWQKAFSKNISNQVLIMRLSSAFIILVSALLALSRPPLLAILSAAAWGGFGATISPALICGIRWRKATREGAIASSIVGITFGFGLYILQQLKLTTFLANLPVAGVGLALAFLTMIVVSLFTQNRAATIIYRKETGVYSETASINT